MREPRHKFHGPQVPGPSIPSPKGANMANQVRGCVALCSLYRSPGRSDIIKTTYPRIYDGSTRRSASGQLITADDENANESGE